MKIYFIGICGTATGNVAILMKRLGHTVCGSDTGMYEPMKSALAKAEVETREGWNPKNVEEFAPELVVVGNAISRMNRELEFVLSHPKYKYTSLPDLIGDKLIADRRCLVVSGTHGKTTTTTLASYILRNNKVDAGWMIGGIPADLPEGGSNLGDFSTAPFVIEGDEYDTAFFDKRSKFIHYKPFVLAINNVEFDHADIFRDLFDVKKTFTHVRRIVSPLGAIVENGDDENVQSLEDTPWVRRIKVGISPNCDVRIEDFKQCEDASSFSLVCGDVKKSVKCRMQGLFNARNAAMAAVSCATVLDREPLDIDLSCLESFNGVKRRQEELFKNAKRIVVEDFGHHPTAIEFTIQSLRQRHGDFKIVACFEPRSNTAKTNVLQSRFAQALNTADAVYIGAINSKKIAPEKRFDSRALAAENPSKIQAFDSNEELLMKLSKDFAENRQKILFVFFSNGSFDNIHKTFAKSLV